MNKTYLDSKIEIEPTSDEMPLFSVKHKGAFGRLLREDRTIGEFMMAKRKPSILFKLLNLFKK
jgi:hypothetical protein